MYSSAALLLAAYQGRPAEASPLILTTATESIARGEGLGSQHANWATAILHNGLGRYADALAAAEQAIEVSEIYEPFFGAAWVLPELVEAAVRSGESELAGDALKRLSAATAIEGPLRARRSWVRIDGPGRDCVCVSP